MKKHNTASLPNFHTVMFAKAQTPTQTCSARPTSEPVFRLMKHNYEDSTTGDGGNSSDYRALPTMPAYRMAQLMIMRERVVDAIKASPLT